MLVALGEAIKPLPSLIIKAPHLAVDYRSCLEIYHPSVQLPVLSVVAVYFSFVVADERLYSMIAFDGF